MMGLATRIAGRSLAVLLWAALLAGGGALAEAADGPLGPLTPAAQLGTDGPWTAKLEGDRFVLDNPAGGSAIRYYRIAWPSQEPIRSVSVKVGVNGTPGSGAGLLYSYDQTAGTYFAFLLLGDRQVALYQRSAAGVQPLTVAPMASVRGDGADLLQIVESGGKAALLVNNETFVTVEANAVGKGEVGIVAAGTGRFAFGGFDFGTAQVAQTPPGANPPQGPGQPPQGPGQPPPGPIAQGPMTPEQRAGQKLLGMVLGAFLHELGHAAIGELEIPATGPEEDVADEFATIVFIHNYRLDPVSMQPLAIASAEAWRISAEELEQQGLTTPWFDEHAPDRIRYGKILCLLYGADPAAFEQTMEAAGIPQNRRARCAWEFPKKWAAWDRLLRAKRRNIDPALPGDMPPDAPGAIVKVQYGPENSPFGKAIAPPLRQLRLFEVMAENLTKYYVWPRPLTIKLQDCEEINAWYSSDDHTVTMCYSLMEAMAGWANIAAGTANAGTPAGPQPTPTPFPGPQGPVTPQPQPVNQPLPGPQPQPAPQPVPGPQQPNPQLALSKFLVGTWENEASAQGTQVKVTTSLKADGTYDQQQIALANNFTVQIYGAWQVSPVGAKGGSITSIPMRWMPAEYCQSELFCQPLEFPQSVIPFTVIDQNTLDIQGVKVRRVR